MAKEQVDELSRLWQVARNKRARWEEYPRNNREKALEAYEDWAKANREYWLAFAESQRS